MKELAEEFEDETCLKEDNPSTKNIKTGSSSRKSGMCFIKCLIQWVSDYPNSCVPLKSQHRSVM